MAYKHVRFDLRTKCYRRRKDYWRAVREGKADPPQYKKPVLFRMKLDPEQAILRACKAGFSESGWWGNAFGGNECVTPGTQGPERQCNHAVRGRGNVGGVTRHWHENSVQPS